MFNTLEDFGVQLASEAGYEPTEAVRAQIKAEADSIRSQLPGVPDTDIIATQGDAIRQKISSMVPRNPNAAPVAPAAPAAPAAPVTPAVQIQTPIADEYNAGMAKVQKDFSPESRQAAQDQTKFAKAGLDIGRALSIGQRVAASPMANIELDRAYREGVTATEEPVRKWAERKAEAIQAVEQKIKAGQIGAQEVRDQMARMGLEQAIQERKDAAAIAAAEADPTSVTSESYRKLALQYAPDLANRLGDRFNTIPASQLKGILPSLEKQYLKMIDIEQKKLESADKEKDRLSREKIAAENNASRERAAAVRAAAKSSSAGTLKPNERLAIEKEEGKVGESLAGARDTIQNFNELESLIKGGLPTGPIVGSSAAGTVAKLLPGGDARQKADNIVKNIVQSAAKAFGGNPTEGERQYIEEANSVMKLDDPLPRLNQLRGRFEELVKLREARVQELRTMKGEAPTGTAGASAGGTAGASAGGTAVMRDRNGKRYNIPRDKVKEALADGLLPE